MLSLSSAKLLAVCSMVGLDILPVQALHVQGNSCSSCPGRPGDVVSAVPEAAPAAASPEVHTEENHNECFMCSKEYLFRFYQYSKRHKHKPGADMRSMFECDHKFHTDCGCIGRWAFMPRSKCPLCRAEPTEKTKITAEAAMYMGSPPGIDEDQILDQTRKFITGGHDINISVNKKGDTMLSAATFFGRLKVIDLLLKNGADPVKTNMDGMSPLHYLINADHLNHDDKTVLEMVDVFLANGRNDDQVHKCASATLDLMVEKFQKDESREKGTIEVLLLAMNKGLFNVLPVLMKQNPLQSEYSASSNIEQHVMKLFEFIVEQVPDIDVELDSRGNTMLNIAATKGYHEIATMLLNKGASLHKKNKAGKCAADYLENFFVLRSSTPEGDKRVHIVNKWD